MSRERTVHRCQGCGAGSPRWAGRCPACGEWNSLVEEVAVPRAEPARGRGPGTGAPAHRRLRPGRERPDPDRGRRAGSGARRRAGAGVGDLGRRRAGDRQVDPAPPGAGRPGRRRRTVPAGVRRGVGVSRCAGGPSGSGAVVPGLWLVAETSLAGHRAPPSRTCTPTSWSSTPSRRCGTPTSTRRPVRWPRSGAAPTRSSSWPRRTGTAVILVGPRHQGRGAGRPPGARAPGGHRAQLRGGPPSRPAPAAGGQAPVRLDGRARPVRDDRGRPGGGGRPGGAVPRRPADGDAGFGGVPRHGGSPAAAGRDPGPGGAERRRAPAGDR